MILTRGRWFIFDEDEPYLLSFEYNLRVCRDNRVFISCLKYVKNINTMGRCMYCDDPQCRLNHGLCGSCFRMQDAQQKIVPINVHNEKGESRTIRVYDTTNFFAIIGDNHQACKVEIIEWNRYDLLTKYEEQIYSRLVTIMWLIRDLVENDIRYEIAQVWLCQMEWIINEESYIKEMNDV